MAKHILPCAFIAHPFYSYSFHKNKKITFYLFWIQLTDFNFSHTDPAILGFCFCFVIVVFWGWATDYMIM